MKKLLVLLSLVALSFGYAQDCEDGFRSVTHAGGETCIPEDPQRIAVVGDRNLGETLLALGLEPTAVAVKDEYPEFVQSEFTDFGTVTDLGSQNEPQLETLLAADPDLILAHSDEFIGSASYETLSEIAPTVQVNPYTNVRQVNEDVGSIFGEAQVAELNTLVDNAVERVASAVDNPSEITVSSIFLRPDQVEIITPFRERVHALLLLEAGFVLPESQREFTDLDSSPRLSLEELNRADADVLFFVGAFGFDNDQGVEDVLGSPLWQSLDAVQSNNVVEGDFHWWSVGGPLSAQRTADDIVAGLEQIGLTEASTE